jgi:hypothetical protein
MHICEHDVIARAITLFSVVTVMTVALGCGKSIPEPMVHDGTPHVSWTISTGDDDNYEKTLVCQSDPRTECVATARRGNERLLGHVDFYCHPASGLTTYTGTVRIGFFDGPAETHAMAVNMPVDSDEKPVSQSTTDLLSSAPGTYSMVIDLVATSASGQKKAIRQDVKILLK